MRSSTSPVNQIPDPAPDAAGLEPSAEGPVMDHAAKPKKNLAAHPVTVAAIMSLALPTLIEQLLSAAIGFTDTYVAGHTVTPGHQGTEDAARTASAAAVGAMTYLQWFVGLMTATLAVGATAIVARSIGAGRPRIANRVAGTSCAAAFLVGIGLALLLYAVA